LEKLGFGENKVKLDNDDWMIALNQPRPFIFIGWEVLPYKQQVTTRNQAKLLTLHEIGAPRLDRLAPLHKTGYRAPGQTALGPGLTCLHNLNQFLPILGVNSVCPSLGLRVMLDFRLASI
jgi:hypothetical protein